MAISTTRLARAIRETRPEPYAVTTRMVLRGLLIESLSKQQRDIFAYVYLSAAYSITAREVAEHFEVSIQCASTVLKELHDWGLLERELVTNEHGREFEYR